MKKGTRKSPSSKLGPTAIQETLCCMFPEDWLAETARATGLVKRERKIAPVAFFWTLVLSYGVQVQRTLAGLKRDFERRTSQTLSDGSWYDRFTPELVKFLKACVQRGIAELGAENRRELGERMKQFDDVLIQDSTIIRLHEKLATHWPATRSRKVAAGVKVSMLVSAVADGPKSVAIHGERTNEIKTLKIGPWVKNRVLLVDLGFFKYHLFARVDENNGYFVSRLKENADPMIRRVLKTHAGRALDLTDKRWSWVRDELKRESVDAEVELNFTRRTYLGEKSKSSTAMRLVAVRDEESGEYHAYLTNIPPEKLTAEEVAALYGMRWEIELVFKELKSRYALDKIKTTNPQVVEALIWISILTMLVSRRLHHVIRKTLPEKKVERFTKLKWSILFMENAPMLLVAILKFLGIPVTLELIPDVFTSNAIDPHVSRRPFTTDHWS